MQRVSACHKGTLAFSLAISGLSAIGLTGCEAPLDLEAVREQSQHPLKRTDFFQSLEQNNQVTIAAGNSGVLLVSGDEGQTWRRVKLPTDQSFIATDTCPDNSFIALTFDNQVWHGSSDGSLWQAHDLPSSEQMMTAACAPNSTWWVAGGFSTIQSSADNGQTWNETTLNDDSILTNLQFFTSEDGIATGEYGALLKTTDGGKSWDYAGNLPDEFYPHASFFLSPQEGWVGGLNGFIYHTEDGGQSWDRQQSDSDAPVFSFTASGHRLFALGDNTTVLELRDHAWRSMPTPKKPLYLRGGVALGQDQLLAAGGRGLMLHIQIPTAHVASNNRGN